MGKKSTSLFQTGVDTSEQHWNLVELEVWESRRQLRQTVNALREQLHEQPRDLDGIARRTAEQTEERAVLRRQGQLELHRAGSLGDRAAVSCSS